MSQGKQRQDSTSSYGASSTSLDGFDERTPLDESFLLALSNSRTSPSELMCITMSSAESLSQIFPDWVRLCYRRGVYQPYDMNMPVRLIPRKALHYQYDSPLTERGQIVAQSYGRGLAEAGVTPFEIYCAPDMKSVQTAYFLFKGLGVSYTTINMEPSLMPYRQLLPPNYHEMLISPKTFFGLGYPINTQYVPCGGFFREETVDAFSTRIQKFYKDRVAILEQKNVVVIADNSVVEITKSVQIEAVEDIFKATKKPTCQMSTILMKKGDAELVDSPLHPFTRSLYAAKPEYWQDVPQKMSTPNHPEGAQ